MTCVKNSIEKKTKRNLKYGFVTIHGIGKNNVSKVIDAISELEENNPAFEKDESRDEISFLLDFG